jgi:hypothetical protein
LGARGRERVETGLNWEIEKTNLLEAYRFALQSPELVEQRAKVVQAPATREARFRQQTVR